MANEPIAPSAEGQKPDLDQILSEKAARLKVLEGEFGALGQQIDEEFFNELEGLLTDDEKELRYEENPAAFARAIEARKEAYKAERLGASEEEINALRQEVGSLQDQQAKEQAKAEFLAAHPDANVDEINAFVRNNMTMAQIRELNALPDYASAFEYVYGLMSGGSGGAKAAKPPAEAPALPPSQDLGAGGLDGEIAPAADDEYLKTLGIK
ncbi:MAG: hypothetical protein LBO72_11035 [Helicobacteraceae bacterium]|jgi:hypothetical protein|nr:hypothetical protein [Helicobacteraceae bacterium]